ncbi:tyrosinase family protein [Rubripirellula amarantea]|nr:tyrosinase family protein [Rubripirellula amarantea]
MSKILSIALLVCSLNAWLPVATAETVANIRDAEVSFLTGIPFGIAVTATGEVRSAGFTDVRLNRAVFSIPPLDGYQVYELTATPPSGSAAQVVTPVSASNAWPFAERQAPWLRGIRVLGEGQGIKEVKLNRRVRRNIKNLSADELATLRRGIEVMKQRPPSDPTSWDFQARIHGTNIPVGSPGDSPLWRQCNHGEHFMSWHRLYVYHFEEILREATGDPDFTLPYWDWLNEPVLPMSFRQPQVAGAENPLFDGTRSINNGAVLPVSNLRNAIDAANDEFDFDSFSSAIYSPHGTVHVVVNGNMSTFATAGLDPIFWLHHCNIDRMWDHWLQRAGGRQNRVDAAFLQRQFSFAASNGSTVTDVVGDNLYSSQLNYNYDTVMSQSPPMTGPILVAMNAGAPEESAETGGPQLAGAPAGSESNIPGYAKFAESDAASAGSSPNGPQLVGAAPGGTLLSMETTRVPLAVANEEVSERAFSMVSPQAQEPKSVLVRITGITLEKPPGFTYGVYLNLPANEQNEDRKNLHLLGVVDLFSASHSHAEGSKSETGMNQVFDATKAIAKLKASGLWNDSELAVTLIPITATAPPADQENYRRKLRDSSEEAQVRYERIEVFSRE